MDEAITQIREQMGLSRRERRTRIECLVRALWIPTERNGTVSWGTGRIPWEEVKEAWTKKCLCDGENNGETICEKCEGRKNKKVRLNEPAGKCQWCDEEAERTCDGCGVGLHWQGECGLRQRPDQGQAPQGANQMFYETPSPEGAACPECLAQWAQEWHKHQEAREKEVGWRTNHDEYAKRLHLLCKPGAGDRVRKQQQKTREQKELWGEAIRKPLMNNGCVAKKELVDKGVGHLNEHPAGQKHVSELTEKEVRGKIWKHLNDTEENIELIQYAGYWTHARIATDERSQWETATRSALSDGTWVSKEDILRQVQESLTLSNQEQAKGTKTDTKDGGAKRKLWQALSDMGAEFKRNKNNRWTHARQPPAQNQRNPA